jgi:putative transposase
MDQQTTRKTYKEKLRPTPAQERALDAVLWRCRDLYNVALEQRITAWQRRHASVSRYEQEAELKEIRAEFPEYAAIHSHVLQDVLARLDKTYQAFFRRLQRGDKAGFPRFKGRTRFHSFTFKEFGNGATLDNGFLVLSKIGRIAVRWSRPLEGTPKTVTISREADGWYVAIPCANVPMHPLPETGQETGIDLGLEAFATLADGTRILTPGSYRRAERYLAKTALDLVRANDVIYHEELRVANMVRNHHLAKSIADAGWSAFLTILAVKVESAGKQVVAVDPAFTSQLCSGCGVVVHKGLAVRWRSCPDCGMSLHRDHNAAKNIQWREARR